MGPKRFYSQNFSLFIVKFKKSGFSAFLRGREKLYGEIETRLTNDHRYNNGYRSCCCWVCCAVGFNRRSQSEGRDGPLWVFGRGGSLDTDV